MKLSNTHTPHLTDAEFSDLLVGERPSATVASHLASCDFCRSELESVQSSVSSFQNLSTRWAEAVAPARVPVPSRWALGLAARTSWPTAIAVTALTGLLVFNYGPAGRLSTFGKPAPAAVAVVPAPPSNAELAEDNRLMLSIDQELSTSTRPAVSAAELRSSNAHRAGQTLAAVLD